MPPSHPILPAIPTTHKLPSSSSAAAAAAAVESLDSKTNLNPNNEKSPEDTDFKLLKSSQNPLQNPPPRTKTATFNLGPNKPQNCFVSVHKLQWKKELVNFKHNHKNNNERRKISQLPDTTTILDLKKQKTLEEIRSGYHE
jgi:hypothetical protein